MAKLSKFGAAFKAARAAGKKEFSFGGKKFTTKTREDVREAKTGSRVPTPTPKPAQATSGATKGSPTKKVEKASQERALTERAAKRGQQGPKPAKAVGVAKAGSRISKASAAKENAPKKREAQGPVAPRAVGVARKGSAISKAVAKRENAPAKQEKKRTRGGGGGY